MHFANIMTNIGICSGNLTRFIFRHSILKEVVAITDIAETPVTITGRNFPKPFYIATTTPSGHHIIRSTIVIRYTCSITTMRRKIVLIPRYGISGKVIHRLKVDFRCDRRKRFSIKKVITGRERHYPSRNKTCLYKQIFYFKLHNTSI
ncbi:hypothetical protein CQW37_02496 [Bacteroides fragilis]|uniref:Uncharacterized protein n=1 Tax=Bacteroides fragilis TaxID=817 RepID=A0A2M9UNY5_BACFG|nr:hypothetical protein CQW35_04224 [Bacteroides fragilis]PJY68131.1 hypothetical protein CQW36_04230 [Bacteroides fragilis]PJY70583.1 hypothetical protein CQW34_04041 [Bacteroides fragilis]PJY81647.1 hypothetical protein CQW33_02389 [Bacteroides fragilis]PJY82370.1 hypothetical protein CQW38_00598 [Bacteroides fragilis]